MASAGTGPSTTRSLSPAWNSPNMSVPTPVIIANGVVFALSDGDSAVQFGPSGNLLNAEDRKARAGHAIVYALDATTGNVLFSSGDTIRGFSHFSAPAVGGGRVAEKRRGLDRHALGHEARLVAAAAGCSWRRTPPRRPRATA